MCFYVLSCCGFAFVLIPSIMNGNEREVLSWVPILIFVRFWLLHLTFEIVSYEKKRDWIFLVFSFNVYHFLSSFFLFSLSLFRRGKKKVRKNKEKKKTRQISKKWKTRKLQITDGECDGKWVRTARVCVLYEWLKQIKKKWKER